MWVLDPDTDGKASALWLNLPENGAAAAVSTITLTEGLDLMLGTRDAINEWLKRRRDQARKEGREEGIEQTNTRWQAWLARMQEAQANGLPFDETAAVSTITITEALDTMLGAGDWIREQQVQPSVG